MTQYEKYVSTVKIIDLLYLVGISEIVLEMSGNCANADKLTLDSKRFSPFRRL